VLEDPEEYCEEPSLLSSPTTGHSPLLEPEEALLPDVDPSELQKGDRRGDWSMLTRLFAVITFLWGESWGGVWTVPTWRMKRRNSLYFLCGRER
jgi:hypothetical protein